MSSDPLPLLRFTAHVSIQPEGSHNLLRAAPDPDPEHDNVWHLHWEVFMGKGPPPNTLGTRSDLYFDRFNRIFYRGTNVWSQWDCKSTPSWPQQPGAHHPNTKDYVLTHEASYGAIYAPKGQVVPSNLPNAKAIIQRTIRSWEAYYADRPEDAGLKDIFTMHKRLQKSRASPSDDVDMLGDDDDEAEVDDALSMCSFGPTRPIY